MKYLTYVAYLIHIFLFIFFARNYCKGIKTANLSILVAFPSSVLFH